MNVRLGDILIELGVLTAEQSTAVLKEQEHSGEPFGAICERLFNVDPEAVEEAWASQYAKLSQTIDPRCEAVDPRVLDLVTRRQAWQFRVLPLRFDGRELVMATTRQHLRRALRFATGVIGMPVFLVLAAPEALGEALCRHYPLPGMTPKSINTGALDRTAA